MIVSEYAADRREPICRSATLSTTNLTWTGLGANTGFRGDKRGDVTVIYIWATGLTSEVYRHLTCQEIPCLKIQYLADMGSPLVPVVGHMNPIHIFQPNAF